MPRYTGLNRESAKHLQLDAGVFIKNYDINKDYDGNKSGIIGMTAGGGSFSAVPTIRQIEADGKRGAVKGLEVLDEWVVTMTANVKEMTADVMAMALAAATKKAATTPTGYTQITPNDEIQETDYLDNVAWVGRLSGSKKPIIIVVYNALATNGLSLTFADKSEGTAALTITGHYDLDDLDKPPFDIFYPEVEAA